MVARVWAVLLGLHAFMCGGGVASAQSRMEDVVHLNSGGITRGQIIEEVPGKSLKIRTRDGSVFVYQMGDIQKIEKDSRPRYNYAGEELKSPGIAFLLSLVVAGGGQYYNEQIGKGVAMTGLYIGGWTLYVAQITSVRGYSDDNRNVAMGGLAIALGAHIWSMIDAPLTAGRINREGGSGTRGHLWEFNRGRQVVGVDAGPSKDGARAGLSLHF